MTHKKYDILNIYHVLIDNFYKLMLHIDILVIYSKIMLLAFVQGFYANLTYIK